MEVPSEPHPSSPFQPTAKPTIRDGDLRRLVNEAHPPRAQDIYGLHAAQKQRRERCWVSEERKSLSIATSLKSVARDAGPRVLSHAEATRSGGFGMPGSPRALEHSSSGFIKAMSDSGLRPVVVYHNLDPSELVEKCLSNEPASHLTSSGALAVLSGAKTGHSLRDKRIVREAASEGDLWWGEGSPNIEMDERSFMLNRERAIDYLNCRPHIYVFDGYAGWDVATRIKVRIICARPYHALFAHNMLVRPTEQELSEFGRPDFTVLHAGSFPANRYTSCMTSSTSIDLSLARREIVILGSQWAGEMKGGLFFVLNYLLPKRGILPVHAACNAGPSGDVCLFFGLSGTGKSTLSSDPRRRLVGDDEQAWTATGVSNVEGGCYAKVIGLTKEREPPTWAAIRFGALLENVVFDEDTRVVDFDSSVITANTRACFPLHHLPNARLPATAGHPSNAILLCCDAFGVLPPVARLTTEQAVFFFLSGYTARVATTKNGPPVPSATFSPCFSRAFLAWHPSKYAAMLGQRLQEHGTHCWLVNTGWTGGPFGVGQRLQLEHTRAIVDAIHSGELLKAEYEELPVFNLQVPMHVPGVPPQLLLPARTWPDPRAYDMTLRALAQLFAANFLQLMAGDEDGGGAGGHMGGELAAAVAKAGPAL